MGLEGKDIREEGMEAYDRYYGTYRGIVHSNEDPKNLGRLQLLVPQVYGDDPFEYWAFPKGIYAGKGVGSFWIPSNKDKVWVVFENGDPRYPIWEYGWWGDGDVPTGATPKIKILQSNTGHRIELDDENGLVRIKDSNGSVVELNSTGVSIVSGKISLGTLDGSAEPAVLGDTLMDLLSDMITMLGGIKTIVTSNGVTSAINTASNWGAFEQKWTTKWSEFKSAKVTLDKQ